MPTASATPIQRNRIRVYVSRPDASARSTRLRKLSRSFLKGFNVVKSLPRKLGAAEMSVDGRGTVAGLHEIEPLNDGGGPQVERLADGAHELMIREHARAVRLHVDGDWLGHADRVGQLNLDFLGQLGGRSEEHTSELQSREN